MYTQGMCATYYSIFTKHTETQHITAYAKAYGNTSHMRTFEAYVYIKYMYTYQGICIEDIH